MGALSDGRLVYEDTPWVSCLHVLSETLGTAQLAVRIVSVGLLLRDDPSGFNCHPRSFQGVAFKS